MVTYKCARLPQYDTEGGREMGERINIYHGPQSATPAKETKKDQQDIISLKQFDKEIPDEQAALAFMEKKIWGDKPYCGRCGGDNVYRVESGEPMSHRCRDCRKYFSIRTGTVMANSQLPFRTWLLAIHLMHTSRKGRSALELHKTLGITYDACWHLCHRIRVAMEASGMPFQGGVVEVDETYIGGKTGRMHAAKRKLMNSWRDNKFVVMGFKDRESGKVVAFPVENDGARTLEDWVLTKVRPGTTVYTDGHPGYIYLNDYGYEHDYVAHGVGEYVNGQVSTNGIESFWSLVKRGYKGTFHFMSWKHLHRYINEFAYRQSAGPGNGFKTIGETLSNMKGKKLPYKKLTGRLGAIRS